MRALLRSVGLVLGMAVAGSAIAGDRNDKSPCNAAEHHQFDFWIGHWEVFLPNGNKAGENRIEAIEGGCALLEQWSGARGPTGRSLNIYDALRRVWHQTWVDSTGGLLVLEGQWMDGRMVLSSSAQPVQRITWWPLSDGSVRQLWETSKDGGRTWSTAFDGKYVKKQP
jgi:hypothetical protein